MTNTQDQPNRLDQIESILLQVAQQQQVNTQVITRLENTVQQNSEAIAELRQELGESISHLVGVIGDFAEEAQQDRVVFQAEIRRIWEYLLQRSGNGSSPPS
jgi:cellulose biosynthesis protein BcsQ